MVDRYRVWLGAGVLAGGVSAAMLAGAGVATADDATSSGAGNQASAGADDADKDSADAKDSTVGSPTTSAAETSGESAGDDAEAESPTDDGSDGDVDDPAENPDPIDDSGDDSDGDASDPDAPDGSDGSDDYGDDGPDSAPPAVSGGKHAVPESEPILPSVPETAVSEPPVRVEISDPAADETIVDDPGPSTLVSTIDTDLGSSDGAAVMQLTSAESVFRATAAPTLFDLFDDLTTSFYNWYTATMQFLAGPARAPFGSRVRVESSTLVLGNGMEVPADWYFPPGKGTPAGLIYLQHGMFATATFYSATAAYLAEKTNSIVVAPTLTWNPLDTDEYPIMLSSTHRAIADLFTGDRAALSASAEAAGFRGTLPTKVVLVGHSAGGGLVVGTARYMVERGVGDTIAGVVMLDGAGTLGVLAADLDVIPHSIPVYNLAAAPDSWNNYGHARLRLQLTRPGMFTGTRVFGGHHADSMQTVSGAVQFMAYLATGFSTPWNVSANQLLSTGWINDMLNGTHTARYYTSSVEPLSLVASSWLSPARSVAVVNLTVPAAVCAVVPAAVDCADLSTTNPVGTPQKSLATRQV